MTKLYLIGLAVVVLLAMACASYASLLHEDVAYWYRDGDQILTQFDPTAQWLESWIPTGHVLLKVQQTVYDDVSTLSILKRNGNGTNHPGYLYAYSITNLNLGNPDDLADMGITNFAVNWDTAPTFVTVSRATLPGWAADTSVATGPAWKWTGAVDPGVMPGETVGGFWAVSNVSVDGQVNAGAVHVGGLGAETLNGRTSGPIPDAPTWLALVSGLAGLGLTRRLRRK